MISVICNAIRPSNKNEGELVTFIGPNESNRITERDTDGTIAVLPEGLANLYKELEQKGPVVVTFEARKTKNEKDMYMAISVSPVEVEARISFSRDEDGVITGAVITVTGQEPNSRNEMEDFVFQREVKCPHKDFFKPIFKTNVEKINRRYYGAIIGEDFDNLIATAENSEPYVTAIVLSNGSLFDIEVEEEEVQEPAAKTAKKEKATKK